VIAAWWQGLAPSERRILAIGAPMAIALLLWALVWHPLAVRRTELEQAIDNQRRDLAYVHQGATELARLQVTGKRSGGDRQGNSLLALADATARSAGMETSLKRVEPVGSRSVRVSFDGANFDALVQWIEALSKNYAVEASDLSADRADGIGLVNARVTLQDAP
jgi:general secretion pathway protein M